jgi:hypothetical protein
MVETAGCPSCASREAVPVSFTWWGGFLGPKLLSHVQCSACGAAYNAKTGRSNNTAIVIYAVVLSVLAGGLAFALELSR